MGQPRSASAGCGELQGPDIISQRASYETFGRWAEYAATECPKRRETLNQLVTKQTEAR